jgi:hypothetical protein
MRDADTVGHVNFERNQPNTSELGRVGGLVGLTPFSTLTTRLSPCNTTTFT